MISTAGGSAVVGPASVAFAAGAAFAVFFAFGAAAPPSAPGSDAGKISFSLRTTGGSTVEEADRTNSPSSLSLAITTLLSRPSSFASS
jgi:hypothetical protein